MWSYIYIALGVTLVSILLIYFDSRLTDKPRSKLIYIKLTLMNLVIVLLTTYILTWLSPSNNIKDVVQSGNQTKLKGQTARIDEINEEIFTNPPNF